GAEPVFGAIGPSGGASFGPGGAGFTATSGGDGSLAGVATDEAASILLVGSTSASDVVGFGVVTGASVAGAFGSGTSPPAGGNKGSTMPCLSSLAGTGGSSGLAGFDATFGSVVAVSFLFLAVLVVALVFLASASSRRLLTGAASPVSTPW